MTQRPDSQSNFEGGGGGGGGGGWQTVPIHPPRSTQRSQVPQHGTPVTGPIPQSWSWVHLFTVGTPGRPSLLQQWLHSAALQWQSAIPACGAMGVHWQLKLVNGVVLKLNGGG